MSSGGAALRPNDPRPPRALIRLHFSSARCLCSSSQAHEPDIVCLNSMVYRKGIFLYKNMKVSCCTPLLKCFYFFEEFI